MNLTGLGLPPPKTMNFAAFTVSWVDLAVVALLITGIFRGRKRGMSEELLDIIRWALVLVIAAIFYQPLGQWLAESTPFSLLSCYIFTYTMIVVVLKLVATFIRRRVGDKLVGSDVFGNAEYYLGMVAGFFRYAMVIIVVFAFLNARYYSPEELQADASFQAYNFGDIRFPTLATLQDQVFKKSTVGQMSQQYLSIVLIAPTAPEDKHLGENNNIARARERDVKQTLDRK